MVARVSTRGQGATHAAVGLSARQSRPPMNPDHVPANPTSTQKPTRTRTAGQARPPTRRRPPPHTTWHTSSRGVRTRAQTGPEGDSQVLCTPSCSSAGGGGGGVALCALIDSRASHSRTVLVTHTQLSVPFASSRALSTLTVHTVDHDALDRFEVGLPSSSRRPDSARRDA